MFLILYGFVACQIRLVLVSQAVFICRGLTLPTRIHLFHLLAVLHLCLPLPHLPPDDFRPLDLVLMLVLRWTFFRVAGIGLNCGAHPAY